MAAKTFAFALCLLAAARAQSSDAAVAVPVVAMESSSAVVVRARPARLRPPAPALVPRMLRGRRGAAASGSRAPARKPSKRARVLRLLLLPPPCRASAATWRR